MIKNSIIKQHENYVEPEELEKPEDFLPDEINEPKIELIENKDNTEKDLIVSLIKGESILSIKYESEISSETNINNFLNEIDNILEKIDNCKETDVDHDLILKNLSKINSLITILNNHDSTRDKEKEYLSNLLFNLNDKKDKLKKDLTLFNNKNFFYRKFNKKEKEKIEEELLRLKENIKEKNQKRAENVSLIHKILEYENLLSKKQKELVNNLLNSYKLKIINENNKIQEEIIKPEVIDSMNNDYISMEFENKLNEAIEKKRISEDDKEFYINYHKKNFAISKNYKLTDEFVNLSEEEKNKFEKDKDRYDKICNRSGLYYFETGYSWNDIPDDSYKNLLSVILSEKNKNELQDELAYIKKEINSIDDDKINEHLKNHTNYTINEILSENFEVNMQDFSGYHRWKVLKNKLTEKKLISLNEIDLIESSIVKSLYNNYVLTEETQGNEGQEAIHIIQNIENAESINLLLDYIKNNRGGHTMNSACFALKKILNNIEINDSKNLSKNHKKEDLPIIKNLINKDSYLNKVINNNENFSSNYTPELINLFTKIQDILEYQEKYSLILEKNGESNSDIEKFYEIKDSYNNENNFINNLKKAIAINNDDEKKVLSNYQENLINIETLNNNTIKITEELDNFNELFNLAVNNANYSIIFKNLEKFLSDNDQKNKLEYDYLKKFKEIVLNENYFNLIFLNFNNINKIFKKELAFNETEINQIFQHQLINNSFELLENKEFPFTSEHKKEVKNFYLNDLVNLYSNFDQLNSMLKPENSFTEEEVDFIFKSILKQKPLLLLEKSNFPMNAEREKIIDVFFKIKNSPSSEMKNIASELAVQLVSKGDFKDIDKDYKKIENIFVKNNIPLIGKQFKVSEALHPKIELLNISSPELTSLHSNNARKLLIFKDLLRANFNSLNSNLEIYLKIFKEVEEVLKKFEANEDLNSEEEERLKYFFNKINSLSENIRKSDKFNKFNLEELDLKENLLSLRNNFNVKEGETLIGKFEKTFLNRVSFNNLSEALDFFQKRKNEVDLRNRSLVKDNKITINEHDLVKGIDIYYFDKFLDRGIYSPEFIGSETEASSAKAKNSDLTPWDTDLIKVFNSTSNELINNSLAAGSGEVLVLVKNRGQFKETNHEDDIDKSEDKLELFRTKYENHYGIRTGFGSTEIDALLVKNNVINDYHKIDNLKFSIAKKGFYIPICDENLNVIYTENEFEEYKKIFNGINSDYFDDLELSDLWLNSELKKDILKFKQSEENISKIEELKNIIYKQIENEMESLKIPLHQGEYDDSVVGAKILDTGSTSRGTALDNDFDFDFVVKYNDNDNEKIEKLIEKLKNLFKLDDDYYNKDMRTLRFKSFKINNELVDLDISFIKKSDSEDLVANEAISKKYKNIEEVYGKERLMDVLTHVRYAKNILKENECYNKGLTGKTSQGGLGGIGVETWILNNGGDVVKAFQSFNENAFENGELISFHDFKKKYKIFGAGNNIRENRGAENFVYNMDKNGYEKMAELSKKFKN